MTAEQKEKIHQMRNKGMSYSKIALELSISENTIKSFCRRMKLGAETKIKTRTMEKCTGCKQCGKPLNHGTKGQPKKFCSDECRRLWWKSNDSQLIKKAYYTLTCAGCGMEFESYGNKNRKFCCHACYINYRKLSII